MKRDSLINNAALLVSQGLVLALIIFSLVTLFGGCAETKLGSAVKAGVVYYCDQPPELRATLRTEANATIAPNHIDITCQND